VLLREEPPTREGSQVRAARAENCAGRRGFTLARDETVVVAEDVITTGGSTRKVIDAVRTPRIISRSTWTSRSVNASSVRHFGRSTRDTS
jgi:hypothetical protein